MPGFVTKEWLRGVIEKSGRHGGSSIQVCSFHYQRALAKGENYSSVAYRGNIIYTVDGVGDEKRIDFFMKAMPPGKNNVYFWEITNQSCIQFYMQYILN